MSQLGSAYEPPTLAIGTPAVFVLCQIVSRYPPWHEQVVAIPLLHWPCRRRSGLCQEIQQSFQGSSAAQQPAHHLLAWPIVINITLICMNCRTARAAMRACLHGHPINTRLEIARHGFAERSECPHLSVPPVWQCCHILRLSGHTSSVSSDSIGMSYRLTSSKHLEGEAAFCLPIRSAGALPSCGLVLPGCPMDRIRGEP